LTSWASVVGFAGRRAYTSARGLGSLEPRHGGLQPKSHLHGQSPGNAARRTTTSSPTDPVAGARSDPNAVLPAETASDPSERPLFTGRSCGNSSLLRTHYGRAAAALRWPARTAQGGCETAIRVGRCCGASGGAARQGTARRRDAPRRDLALARPMTADVDATPRIRVAERRETGDIIPCKRYDS
jgi:hypothetical protein